MMDYRFQIEHRKTASWIRRSTLSVEQSRPRKPSDSSSDIQPVVSQSSTTKGINRLPHGGLSLLEVVLSLAILAVAAAYLAQSVFLATENAIRAQKLSQAELVAESLMNQIVAGILPAQQVNWVGYSPPNPLGPGAMLLDTTSWVYSIAIVNTEVQGMVGIQIAVQQVEPGSSPGSQPDLTVVRWIIDPNLGLDTPPDATATPPSTNSAMSSRPEFASKGIS